MIVSICFVTYLCQHWIYVPGTPKGDLTKEQMAFELWLWIEVLIIYG